MVWSSLNIKGSLTQALLDTLLEYDDNLTEIRFIEALSDRLEMSKLFVVGQPLDQVLFGNWFLLVERVFALLTRITQQPIFEMIQILQRLIEQYNGSYAEGYLNLGVAYAAVGEYEKSIDALDKAIDQNKAYPEARYHLGRVLFESDHDLARAMSELRQVLKSEPENARAAYYLGQAIRAIVEREILVEAEGALKSYLAAGAPLGNRADVEAFLKARRGEQEPGGTR